MAQVTGRVFISINGGTVQSKPGATYKAGGLVSKAVIADSGVVGPQQSVVAPQVDFTIPHTAKVSIKQIQAMQDVTLIFRTDTGVEFTLEHAFCSDTPSLNSTGDLKCQFQAITDRENVPS